MPDEHAVFSPSASERWLTCPASVPLSEGLDSGDTIHSARGTAIHDLAERFLRDWTHIEYIEHDHGAIAFTFQDEPVVIPPEEWRPHVVPYVQAVRADYQRWKDTGFDVFLLVEERVTVVGSWCWGSCDAAVVVPGWYLGTYDLKTGAGKIVDANNPQNLSYLAGLAAKHKWDFEEYACHISQEANRHEDNIDKYQSSKMELKAHLSEVKKAIKSSAKAKPGPIGDHCQWCPAKAEQLCPAQKEAVVAIFNDSVEPKEAAAPMKATPERVPVLSIPQLEWVIQHAAAMRDYISACEDYACRMLQMGVEIGDWKVVRSVTKRRWTSAKTTEDLAAELELYGVEEPLTHTPKLITIGQAEKILGKGQIDALVEKPEGSLVLAPGTDKRPAVKPLVEAMTE